MIKVFNWISFGCLLFILIIASINYDEESKYKSEIATNYSVGYCNVHGYTLNGIDVIRSTFNTELKVEWSSNISTHYDLQKKLCYFNKHTKKLSLSVPAYVPSPNIISLLYWCFVIFTISILLTILHTYIL